MIGLGTQDSLGEAEEFVDEFDTRSFTMLWDESFEAWQALGISSQPSAVLLAADGTLLQTWVGAFPEDEVLQLSADD